MACQVIRLLVLSRVQRHINTSQQSLTVPAASGLRWELPDPGPYRPWGTVRFAWGLSAQTLPLCLRRSGGERFYNARPGTPKTAHDKGFRVQGGERLPVLDLVFVIAKAEVNA